MKRKGQINKSEAAIPEASVELSMLNRLGIHARPAAAFVKIANNYKSLIFAEKDGETVNAKSIMGMMLLAAGPGSKFIVRARGPDAKEAIQALEALAKNKFYEE